jgi:hypothetical protein
MGRRPRDLFSSELAGKELNIAQLARRQAGPSLLKRGDGCFGSALFLLSKVTAGTAGNER